MIADEIIFSIDHVMPDGTPSYPPYLAFCKRFGKNAWSPALVIKFLKEVGEATPFSTDDFGASTKANLQYIIFFDEIDKLHFGPMKGIPIPKDVHYI